MIPFEKGLPFIGNFLAYNKDKLKFITKMYEKHGDTFKIKIGNFTLTVVTHPEDIAHIMQGNFNNYIKKSNVENFFGPNIFFSNIEVWKKQRKMIQPVFKNDHITSFLPLIDQICEEEFNKISESDSFNIQEFFNIVSFKIIASTIIGKEFQDHYQLKHHFKIVTDGLTQIKYIQGLSFLFSKRNQILKESMEFIDKTIYKVIADKKISRDFGTDALSNYIKIQETNDTLTDTEIRDQLVALIFAGYETSALSMSWLSFLLAKNKKYQEVLKEEFKIITDKNIQASEGSHFTKVDNIIKESMRIYPVGWAWTRVALADDQLRDHKVLAGEIVFISSFLTHRSSKHWDNPLHFSPERFQEEIVKGSFFPFGYGPRTCIGMTLAMIEMRIMLKHLIERFEIEDCNYRPIIRPQITLDVLGGIKVGLKKRPD